MVDVEEGHFDGLTIVDCMRCKVLFRLWSISLCTEISKFTDHCHRFICIFGYMVVVKRSAFGGLCELCELS